MYELLKNWSDLCSSADLVLLGKETNQKYQFNLLYILNANQKMLFLYSLWQLFFWSMSAWNMWAFWALQTQSRGVRLAEFPVDSSCQKGQTYLHKEEAGHNVSACFLIASVRRNDAHWPPLGRQPTVDHLWKSRFTIKLICFRFLQPNPYKNEFLFIFGNSLKCCFIHNLRFWLQDLSNSHKSMKNTNFTVCYRAASA